MKKEKIKKVIKGLGIAGLAAGIGLMSMGCKKDSSSCGKGSCGGNKTSTEKSSSSCGKGSCGT